MIHTESFEDFRGKKIVGKTQITKSNGMSRHRQVTLIAMDLRGSGRDEFLKT